MSHPPVTFDDLVGSLSQLGEAVTALPPEAAETIDAQAAAIAHLDVVTRDELTQLLSDDDRFIGAFALALGLSSEQMKNQAKLHLDASVRTAARSVPNELVAMLDDKFDLVAVVSRERRASYTYADILKARAQGRVRASAAIGRGRELEDRVEEVVSRLGLECDTRTRFDGTGGDDAPCDIAIPAGGAAAKIAVAIKVFNSTGSKLTDAVREVEQMAKVRRPDQYVFAVVDGIGWLNRRSDLKRLYDLWEARRIEGVYTMNHFDHFADELADAALRSRLV